MKIVMRNTSNFDGMDNSYCYFVGDGSVQVLFRGSRTTDTVCKKNINRVC